MINVQQVAAIINGEDISTEISSADLKSLVGRYPYYQVGIFLYLRMLYNEDKQDEFSAELERTSIFINDRKALFYFLFEEEYKQFFKETGKTEIEDNKTNILLDAFFNSRKDLETDTLLEYSLNHSSLASNDYFSYVENIEHKEIGEPENTQAAPELKFQNIIDSFIEKSENGEKIDLKKISETDKESQNELEPLSENINDLADDRFFTETLAKIYVKQKKYEKAYRIIKHLSLNYPEKNIYFADQLSFLEKLIVNSKYKNKI